MGLLPETFPDWVAMVILIGLTIYLFWGHHNIKRENARLWGYVRTMRGFMGITLTGMSIRDQYRRMSDAETVEEVE